MMTIAATCPDKGSYELLLHMKECTMMGISKYPSEHAE